VEIVKRRLRNTLRQVLSVSLSAEDVANVYNSYDVIGDIAILRLREASVKHRRAIARAVMSVHRNVKTVVAQLEPVQGIFRTRRLRHVAGEHKTVTTHFESGCALRVDVSSCYFSPRLSHERMRIARLVKNGEVAVNMFAGVGCFSILMSKFSEASRVYSIDVNPAAFHYMQENVRLNGVYGKVIPILGDAKEIIVARLRHIADRVLMPLPEKALEYLPYSLLALKKTGGFVHYYDFEHSKKGLDAVEKVKLKVTERLAELDAVFSVVLGRVVRSTGPNWYQVVLDIAVSGQFDKFNKGS
jgi:tRNA (guanine37-N1)-methyltransferase